MTKQTDNSFALLLQHQRSGDCMDELSEKLRDLGKAVTALGKKGTLVLTITMNPTSKGAGSAVAIKDTIKLNAPSEESAMAIFFVGSEGDLSRSDPRQRELPLTVTTGGKQEEQNAVSKAV